MKVSKDLLHELGLIHVKVIPRFDPLICTTLTAGCAWPAGVLPSIYYFQVCTAAVLLYPHFQP
jgi:hypothetical protein